MSDPTIHILSTRPLPPALVAAAADQGIHIETRSFIATEAIDDKLLGNRIASLGNDRLVAVFTSINAVEAVAAWTKEAADWTIFCIGNATRQMVEKFFAKTPISDTAESALALSEKIIHHMEKTGPEDGRLEEKKVFFFCGDQRREELPSALRQAGVSVNEVIVYRTTPTPHKTERAYEGIVFFSPSAVESFFSLNTVNPEVLLFAIGRTTANAIRTHCSNTIINSKQPDKEVLIQQVIDHFSNYK